MMIDGALPPIETVWNVALENVMLSPTATVTLPGRNVSSVAPFGVPAGGRVCSPRNTL